MARILSDETTLSRRRRALTRESDALSRFVWPVEAALAVLFLAAGGWAVRSGRGGGGWLAAGGAAGFLAVAHRVKAGQAVRERDALGAGLAGERSVARHLARELDNRHYVFNDLTIRSGFRAAQIDHVVVGPRGIFLIETKNWSGRISGGPDDPYWRVERDASRPPRRLGNPLLQNRRHAAVMRSCLKSCGAPDMPLVPLLVFASPAARVEADAPGARIARPEGLAEAIAGHPSGREWTEAEIDAVISPLRRFL